MKKITAFFLVLLPIFITGLMFISGLIQNMNFPISVVGVSITESDQDIAWEQDGEKTTKEHFQFHAHVLPLNAKNQQILWSSSNPDIAEVNDEGYVTIKQYGKVMIKATAAGNQNCSMSREIDSFDTIVHDINVTNLYNLNYLSVGSISKPSIITYPTIDHVSDSSMEYTITDGKPTNVIDINKNNGMITAKEIGTTQVTIKAVGKDQFEQRQSKAVKTLDITVADPLNNIVFENMGDETITDSSYDLYNALRTSPAQKKEDGGYLQASDFEFTSSNTDVAEIDKEGKISFYKANEYVTFDVTYKRNTDLKISKRILTTNNNFKQIYFNQSSIDVECDPNTEISYDKLNWVTYPESSSIANYEVVSTDNNVVEVTNQNTVRPSIKAINPGKCTLKISTSVGADSVISDICNINVSPKAGTLVKASQVQTSLDTPNYYPLFNNINIAKTSLATASLEYTITKGNDIAYIDDNNILHFKGNGTVGISVTMGEETGTFDVTNNTTVEQLKVQDISTIVGKKFQYTDETEPKFDGKYYQDYFDVNEESKTFIPNRGCDIPDFEFTNGKKVHLIVREDPIYIATDHAQSLTTPEEEVDFVNTFNPRVVPSTAMKSDGTIYTPKYTYVLDNYSTGKINENTITFARIGSCDVNVSYGNINSDSKQPELFSNFEVRCTFHDKVGKFAVTTNNALPLLRKTKSQYSTWDKESDSYETLRISDVSHSLYKTLQIKSMNGLCNPTIQWVGLILTGHIELNLNPITGAFGDDVIEISSPTYSLFLKVHLDAKITDFVVSFNGETWSNEPILTYTYKLDKIRITPNTAGLKAEGAQKDWSWSIDGGEKISEKGNASIDLSNKLKADGEYALNLYVDNVEIKQFKIIKKTPSETMKVELYGCENGIYASYNSKQKSTLIVTDGYVDDSFYDNFIWSELETSVGEKITIDKNVITISDFPSKDAENYHNKFELKFGKDKATAKTIKTYDVGKDCVSKIKLPGHNIYDESDKKGMQKVHVYGNYSSYVDDEHGHEGVVNYYKVPVILYDKNRKEIGPNHTETEKKVNILKNLNISIGGHSGFEIDPSGEYIRVIFNNNDLYTPEEMYKNAFDAKTGKNIDFSVATKSNEVSAQYKFVAVEGTNTWEQETLSKMSRQELPVNSFVLQTNFGIAPTKTEYNAVFDDQSLKNVWTVYGNGYSLNFQYVTKKNYDTGHDTCPNIKSCFNLDLAGGDTQTLLTRKEKCYTFAIEDEVFDADRYIAYCIFHNWDEGLVCGYTNRNIYFKNTIFHSYLASCLRQNYFTKQRICPLYLENCSFFNAAGFPIYSIGACPIHFKGDIGVYNFRDKEMLRRVGVVDLTSLWPLLLKFARSNNMVHKDYKDDEVVNSFMVTALNPETYFYDNVTQQYVKSTRGIPGSAKYLSKYADISMPLPIVGSVGASMWGGTNPSFEPGAPSYYDEFDADGRVKMSFLNEQIIKLTRHPKYF